MSFSHDQYVKDTVGIGNRLAALERRMSDLENSLQFLRLYIEQNLGERK